MLDSGDPNVLDGAFSTLAKICEDSAEKLATDPNPQALNMLIPKFISFFSSPHEPLRRYAVGCTNHFILLLPEPLKQARRRNRRNRWSHRSHRSHRCRSSSRGAARRHAICDHARFGARAG